MIKRVIMGLLALGVIALYTFRAFHPEQPLHHQLNDAAGVLLIALLLVWVFFPPDHPYLDEDDDC